MSETITIIDPYDNYEILEQDYGKDAYGNGLLNSVQSLQVGFGSKVMRVDRDGLWLGGADFATAPFKVDMSGNITAATLDLSGFLSVGEALADVQADIFDLSDIDTDLGTIYAGNLIGITVTGGTIQTSSSGARVTITGSDDNIRIYDSSNNERMRLDQDEFFFYDASGNTRGKFYTSSTSLFLEGGQGGWLILNSPSSVSSYGIILQANEQQKMAITTNGVSFSDDVELGSNDLRMTDGICKLPVGTNRY